MNFLKLIRINQWTKNLFIFAPLFFSGQFLEPHKLFSSFLGFICFCLAASGIYILNDIIDVEKDRLHPGKKNRPVASGKIQASSAKIYSVILLCLGLTFAFITGKSFFVILSSYVLLNIFYCVKLKQISLIDIFILAIGFVLRVAAGGVLTGISVSHWLYIMTFLLALFIAFGKRRDDVLILNETDFEMRHAVKGYNLDFISSSISILSAVLIVTYLLYITSPEVVSRFEGKHAYISALFVILGLLRYLQVIFVYADSGSPSKFILKDLFIQLVIIGWILFFVAIIYFV